MNSHSSVSGARAQQKPALKQNVSSAVASVPRRSFMRRSHRMTRVSSWSPSVQAARQPVPLSRRPRFTISNRAISLSKHHIILPSNDRATICSCYSQHKKRLRGLDRWVWMRNKSKEIVDNTVAKSVRVRPCIIVRTCRPVLSTEPDE